MLSKRIWAWMSGLNVCLVAASCPNDLQSKSNQRLIYSVYTKTRQNCKVCCTKIMESFFKDTNIKDIFDCFQFWCFMMFWRTLYAITPPPLHKKCMTVNQCKNEPLVSLFCYCWHPIIIQKVQTTLCMRVDQDECYPPYPLPHKQSFGILSFTPAKFTKFPETLL